MKVGFMIKEYLYNKIKRKEIIVGVIGPDYVGLPLSVESAMSGFNTIGFEIQQDKIKMLTNRINYIQDVKEVDLKKVLDSGSLQVTSNYNLLRKVDFIVICVPTPLDAYKQPDIGYIIKLVKELSLKIKKGTMVVLES